ncbi:hypothetical protein [Tranquillimonas rosea]
MPCPRFTPRRVVEALVASLPRPASPPREPVRDPAFIDDTWIELGREN